MSTSTTALDNGPSHDSADENDDESQDGTANLGDNSHP